MTKEGKKCRKNAFKNEKRETPRCKFYEFFFFFYSNGNKMLHTIHLSSLRFAPTQTRRPRTEP